MTARSPKTKTTEAIKETTTVPEPTYKTWEEKSNEERLASINEYSKSILAKAIGEKKAFWNKDMSAKEIDNSMPFNASTGQPYNGITSLLLRAVSELNGYDKPEFLTMKQANFMGGTLKKQLDENGNEMKTRNGATAYVKGVKVAFYQEFEYKPKLDENGREMTRVALDKNDNPKLDKDGQEIKQSVLEKVYLKNPRVETVTLYHVSSFDGLQIDKLKERDMSKVMAFREKQKESSYDFRPKVDSLNMGKNTSLDLENFLNSQNKGVDYQKIQHQRLEYSREQTRGQEMQR